MENKEPNPRTLYIVATPIGNLEDMTFRAVRILQNVDLIAAEDTRHTGKLLQYFQVKTPQISYHEHNRTSRIPELLDRLSNGSAIALVSDAGMPGISDPGYELVKACVEVGITVVPIPGATAAVAALSASGLPTDKFVFEGFLAAKSNQRRQRLSELQQETRTLIFYESPHRLRAMLEDVSSCLGEREIVLARELTKLHEEFWRGTVEDAIAYYQNRDPQGEYTVIIAGAIPEVKEITPAEIQAELTQLLQQGISPSQASREVAKRLSLSRRDVYSLALSLTDENNPKSKI